MSPVSSVRCTAQVSIAFFLYRNPFGTDIVETEVITLIDLGNMVLYIRRARAMKRRRIDVGDVGGWKVDYS